MQKLLQDFQAFYHEQDKIIFYSISSSLFMAFFIFLLWALNYSNLPPEIPLFYSLPWGDPQLASLTQFLILISMIILILLLNLIISWHLHPSQLLAKRMIALTTSATSLLILITALKILYVFL